MIRSASCSFFAVVLLAAWSQIAVAQKPKEYVVAIVNVECNHCFNLYRATQAIESMVESAGMAFKYAPMPNHTQAQIAWPERAFYASRFLPDDLHSQVLNALFDAQKSHRLHQKDQVIAWLQMSIPEVDWPRFFHDHVEKDASKESVAKAITLAQQVALSQFPTFVHVTSNGPVLIAGNGTNEELVTQLKSYLEKQN